MLKKYPYIILLFYISIINGAFSQNKKENFYSKTSYFYSNTKDNLSIQEIIKKLNNSEFKKEEDVKIYKELGNKTLWYHFKLEPNNKLNYKYLRIDNSYLSYGKIFYKKGNKIDSLHTISNNKFFPHKNIFYRNPVWKIPLDSLKPIDVFLKIKNSSGRTRLVVSLETENDFFKKIEIEYFYFGLFIAFLISMTLILVFFSVLKKEYSVLYYAFYIVTVFFEFLAAKGIGVQYIWSDNVFIINNIRSFSQTIGVLCFGLFYLNFYKLNKSLYIPKAIFKWGTYITFPLIAIYFYKFLFGGLTEFYLIVWLILKIIIFIWVLNHIYLTIKKQLPLYLVIAFILPILAVINGQIMNPSVNNTFLISLSGPNIYYIMLSLEILLFTRFIFGAVIDTQKKYLILKKVSDELKYNFQNKALELQNKERNNLVNNVHDTFGGYLEALKLRLLQKAENTPEKIQEILEAFYKDYRYLLNSLYAPKINSENFINNLVEFCEKLDKLTKQHIYCDFKIDKIDLQQEKCMHLYRIISELTTNAIKYSQSSEIKIKINQHKKEAIILEISDNGIGFDKNKITKSGFGLNSVKNRIEQLKGSLDITSNNKGTLFKIEIPIND